MADIRDTNLWLQIRSMAFIAVTAMTAAEAFYAVGLGLDFCDLSLCEKYAASYYSFYDNIPPVIARVCSGGLMIIVILLGAFPGSSETNSFGVAPHVARLDRKRRHDVALNDRLHFLINRRSRAFQEARHTLSLAIRSNLLTRTILSVILRIFGLASVVCGLASISSPWRLFKITDRQHSLWFYLLVVAIWIAYIIVFMGIGHWLIDVSARLYQRVKVVKAILRTGSSKKMALYLRPFMSDRVATIKPYDVGSNNVSFRIGMLERIWLTMKMDKGGILTGFRGFRYLWAFAGDMIVGGLSRRADLAVANKAYVPLEDFLDTELRNICTLVALGVDEVGVAHIPSVDEDWHQKLVWLVSQCQCVIYVPGPTLGAIKEFELICDSLLAKTIFVSVPTPKQGWLKRWRRAFPFDIAWNKAIEQLSARRPDLADMLGRLVYRVDGSLYRIDPASRQVDEHKLAANKLVWLVRQTFDANK